MKMRYLVAASVAFLMTSASAKAADIIYQEPMPVFSWQGFYIGGQIGGLWGSGDLKVKNLFDGAVASKKWSPDPSGFIGGLYAGYNFDAGNNVILGLDTDFVWTDASKSRRTLFDGNGYGKARLKEKWLGTTRVRIGYGMDRWLPYAFGGVAYGKVESRIRTTDTSGNFLNAYNNNKTLTGWTAGVGVDYAMTDNILLRLEYRYTDLGSKKFNYGYTDTSLRYKVDYSSNDFRVGVAYKF